MDINTLKKTPLFEIFSDSDLKTLASSVLTVEVIANDTVFSEGSKADSLYFIQYGSVKIVKSGKQDDQSLRELSEKNIFGEMGLLDQAPRAASVIAKENVKLLKIPYLALELLLQKDPKIGMKLYKHLGGLVSKRIRATSNDLTEIRDLKLRHV